MEEERTIAYNNLLQAYMIPLLIRKKIEIQKKKIKSEIIAINKQYNEIQNQLFKLEKRIIDIQWLFKLNAECDDQCMDMNKRLDIISNSDVNLILLRLKELLKSISLLKSKNVKLPETEEESTIFLNSVQECFTTLETIQIDKFKNIFENIQLNLNNYSSYSSDINSKVLELINNLNELQFLVLRYASDSFAQL